ncbi:hypothetical protein fugu_013703 [Takifugu bimaculatus]|uniref:Uncharacterized protein n=1 Tax=Takifugu bimaculatus TaxID=433685 RepID=A0A4Z2C3Z9_9TELE|nr:hypothetical protein fugu_013703 [Takifugu bimaculatus]
MGRAIPLKQVFAKPLITSYPKSDHISTRCEFMREIEILCGADMLWSPITETGEGGTGRDVWDVQDPVFVQEDALRALPPPVMLSDGCGRAPHWRDAQTLLEADCAAECGAPFHPTEKLRSFQTRMRRLPGRMESA